MHQVTSDMGHRRRGMVREQLLPQGITDEGVLKVLGRVPRHLFVDHALQAQAYSANALPIGYGQTISQPISVARMTQALQVQDGHCVLEIGTGSGYQAAVLAEMGAEVYSVERIKPLYLAALDRLTRLRYFQVKLKLDDGTLGWPENGPYDRILITAGGPKVPEPLLRQLADPGILVMPLEENGTQRIVRIRRERTRWYKQDMGPARFVSLIGTYGSRG
ncbi:protein-L-isoaspartate(D-aspartate) O-methyltransferase [Desulfovermiculus halophilus]|uniref:protein-L-isoaspartate(D-aspartate) O-methyltransferase n=1 Tax=Desulfovermiculus halophilus TaxID=339722 RepID=UPI000A02CBB4|nr:protein-L-isoaspartate(D-aspartate) O-methyltransferase [Desulfovermiculus halophilus]